MTTEEFEHTAILLRPRLVSIGRDFFGHGNEAEDVAQETLARLWVMRGRLVSRPGIERLAVRMARNICVSEWRKQKVRRTADISVAASARAEQHAAMDEADGQRLLAEAVNLLSPTEKKLFRMRQELGMDLSQMAIVTGIKPRSISAMLSAARQKVFRYIKRHGGTDL